MAEPGVWRDDNRAPFWIPDGARAFSGPSFDDYVRAIDPSVDPDVWREYSAPQYDSYHVPFDPRAAALGAFRIPGLPDEAAEWELRERSPAGADAMSPVQLAARKRFSPAGILLERIWRMIGGVPGRRADGPPARAPHGRKGYPLQTPEGPPRNRPG